MSAVPLVMCHPPFSVAPDRKKTRRSQKVIQRLLAIFDGQNRSGGYDKGYLKGYLAILAFVEASAAGRFGVQSVATPLCSIQNVQSRSLALFEALLELLTRLHAAILRGAALRGVRVKWYGDLDILKRAGGFAERTAYQIEAVCDATADAPSPSFEWWLFVAYGPEALRAVEVDAVIRTGMEETNVLRLSNLDPHSGVALLGVTTLGPEMSLDRFDSAVSELQRCAPARFEPGYSCELANGALLELGERALRGSFNLILPVDGSKGDIARLTATHRPALARRGISLVDAADELGALVAPSRSAEGRSVVALVSPALFRALSAEGPADIWLLSSTEERGACRLSDVRLGDANVHIHDGTPSGTVEALQRALQFSACHESLHGGERRALHEARAAERHRQAEHLQRIATELTRDPRSTVTHIARCLEEGSHVRAPELHWDIAAVREVAVARANGLLPRNAKWERAALGYAYTATITAYRAVTDIDPTGEDWEKTARFLSPVLMAVGCTDEEVFERWPGERPDAARARCVAAATYLSSRALGDRYVRVPDVAGWEQLGVVAAFWERLREERAPIAHPRVLQGFFQAVAELYSANIAEQDSRARRANAWAVVRDRVPSSTLQASKTSMNRVLPARVSDWMRTLEGPGERRHRRARLQLAVLRDLQLVHPSIAAGIVCRALAMMIPAPMWAPLGLELHEEAATLMDLSFRLRNDLSSLVDSAEGDRDHKDNTWTVLVSDRAGGKARERAVAEAVAACQDVQERLDDALDDTLHRMSAVAPRLAALVRRSVHFGRLAYSGQHYSKLDLGELHRMGAATLQIT
ncbi:MAG: hypothetical protein U0441_27235 [Polyangiaceae bacterium]